MLRITFFLLLFMVVNTTNSLKMLGKSGNILNLVSAHMSSVSPAGNACLMIHSNSAMSRRYLSNSENSPPVIINKDKRFYANEECLHLILSSNGTEALKNLIKKGQLTLRSRAVIVADQEIAFENFKPRLTLVRTDGQVLRMRADRAWMTLGHVDDDNFRLEPSNKLDLLGRRLEARAVVYPPWYSENKLDDNTNLAQGIEVSLLSHILDALNASVRFATPEDGGLWGVDKNKTGNYDGLVGSLQRAEADVGFAQLFVKHHRTPFMDFTREYDVDSVCFLTTISPPLPQSLALVRPFRVSVWGCILVSILFSMLFLAAQMKIGVNSNSEPPALGRRFLLLLAIIAFEPDVSFPRIRNSPLRLFLLAYSLGFVVLSRSYSSGMTSLLTVPMRNPPIDSLQGVAQTGLSSASLGYSTYIQRYSTNPWIKQLRPTHIALDYSIPLVEVFRGAANNSYVLYQSEKFLRHTVRKAFTNEYGETELHVVPECPEGFNVALGLVKGSILKPSMDEVIQRYKERGLIQRWTQIEAERYGQVAVHEKNEAALAEPFNMENMEGPFLGAIIAALVATMTFGLELMMGKKKETLDSVRFRAHNDHDDSKNLREGWN